MPQWVNPQQYTTFENEEQAVEFCKNWGLLPQKATKQKLYKYKGQNMDVPCEIIGYADLVFAVIQVGDNLHNIHPSYLREMQTAQYGKIKPEEELEETADYLDADSSLVASEIIDDLDLAVLTEFEDVKPAIKKASKEKKIVEKPAKEVPLTFKDEKVSITATAAEFATVPNPFSDTDDEVIIFQQVSYLSDGETITLESAWSSHSNAFKKEAVQIGDQFTFEAKLVPKKLSKHPVKYKINNAAKITKVST